MTVSIKEQTGLVAIFVKEGKNKKMIYVDYEGLLEIFEKSIHNESWKMLRAYPNLDKDEILQSFMITLWESLESYTIEGENCFSTHLYWQFKLCRKKILDSSMMNKKAQFNNKQVNSIDKKVGDSDTEFSNQRFEFDPNFQKMEFSRPDTLLMEKSLISIILKHLNEQEADMLNVLLQEDYSVADYAKKWKISRMGANKRKNKLKEKIANIITNEWK